MLKKYIRIISNVEGKMSNILLLIHRDVADVKRIDVMKAKFDTPLVLTATNWASPGHEKYFGSALSGGAIKVKYNGFPSLTLSHHVIQVLLP
jgi:hypothetical protein